METELDPLQYAALRALRAAHWKRTRKLTALLLLLWFGTSFCTVFFARELSGLTVFGWPLSFYLAAQGASLVSLLILAIYARRMHRLDQQFEQQEAELHMKDPA